jgi:transposase-like protein
MGTIRKKHSAQFKFKLALEAAKENKTLNELASQHSIHQGQISQWKKLLMDQGPQVFAKNGGKARDENKETAALYEQIGQLTVELNWFKKNFRYDRK